VVGIPAAVEGDILAVVVVGILAAVGATLAAAAEVTLQLPRRNF